AAPRVENLHIPPLPGLSAMGAREGRISLACSPARSRGDNPLFPESARVRLSNGFVTPRFRDLCRTQARPKHTAALEHIFIIPCGRKQMTDYRSDVGREKRRGQEFMSAPALIGCDEFQLAIPWRIGLHQSPPPLHQPGAVCSKLGSPVEEFADNRELLTVCLTPGGKRIFIPTCLSWPYSLYMPRTLIPAHGLDYGHTLRVLVLRGLETSCWLLRRA